jgi:hypothetical protein
MPHGLVDGSVRIQTFFVMIKWAPPMLNDLNQIVQIADERNRKRTIKFAIENPEEFGFPYPGEIRVSVEDPFGKDLTVPRVSMADPAGHKMIPV